MMPTSIIVAMLALSASPMAARLNATPTHCYENEMQSENPQAERSLEKLPAYPGGLNGLMTYLANNVKYPETAMKTRTEGKVIVRFVVDKDGNVVNPEVITSVHPDLDAEAIRVVSSLKGFSPAISDGQPVDCYFSLPITFKLSGYDLDY